MRVAKARDFARERAKFWCAPASFTPDAGYVTVTPDLRFEVSRRIKEEFDNGRHYYELHGKPIFAPKDILRRPDPEVLRWHNEHAYRG
jgi:putative restriction endonuclease